MPAEIDICDWHVQRRSLTHFAGESARSLGPGFQFAPLRDLRHIDRIQLDRGHAASEALAG